MHSVMNAVDRPTCGSVLVHDVISSTSVQKLANSRRGLLAIALNVKQLQQPLRIQNNKQKL
ncbi:hypothetical protein FGIG_00693 [Fasciola gigantica]|uniref:Uncharacterized protein n=1 Tax=Fasciola gigantica TaxID=46835 RepID=A0A504Y4U9_FASGI|nr:hypothetical protein FGIG_00693 [Fasciola gigantica]